MPDVSWARLGRVSGECCVVIPQDSPTRCLLHPCRNSQPVRPSLCGPTTATIWSQNPAITAGEPTGNEMTEATLTAKQMGCCGIFWGCTHRTSSPPSEQFLQPLQRAMGVGGAGCCRSHRDLPTPAEQQHPQGHPPEHGNHWSYMPSRNKRRELRVV